MAFNLVFSLIVCIQVVTATQYEVRVKTGYEPLASTDANVFITIYGTGGKSAKTRLNDSRYDLFERGNVNRFTITTPSNLGQLTKLTVEHDNSGLFAGWFLDNIIIWNGVSTWPKYYFDCYNWLTSSESRRTLPALRVDAPNTDYVVEVVTGDKSRAGTNSHVYITLGGTKGRTPKIELKDSKKDTFQKGNTDTFHVKSVDLNQLNWLFVEQDGLASNWYLDKIVVYNKAHINTKRTFECDCWLAKNNLGDKKLSHNLTAQIPLVNPATAECPGDVSDFIDNHCVVTEICTKITCNERILGQNVKIVMKIHKCDDPVTIDVKAQLGTFKWEHTFKGDELVKILKIPIPFVDVSMKVHIEKTGGKLQFKVSVQFVKTLVRTEIILAKVELPITTKECPNKGASFWDHLSRVVRGLLIGGVILLMSIVFVVVCCRFFYSD